MPTAERIPWAKDPKYPTKNSTCSACGEFGLTKLAWDRIGFICISSAPCLARTAARYQAKEN